MYDNIFYFEMKLLDGMYVLDFSVRQEKEKQRMEDIKRKNGVKMYFEFVKQDYYGLVTITANPEGYIVDEAVKVYVDVIGGSVDEVLDMGFPRMVTKAYAFYKLATCEDSKKYRVEELLKEFNELEDCCIIIDGGLV